MGKRIAVYLDTDTNGADLLDNVGNPIQAGWYVYDFPMTDDPLSGPHETAPIAQAEQ